MNLKYSNKANDFNHGRRGDTFAEKFTIHTKKFTMRRGRFRKKLYVKLLVNY